MTQPSVELLFHPTDLDPRDLARAGQFLGSPSSAIEAGLGALRLMMVDRMKTELAGVTGVEVNSDTLMRVADIAWQAAFWKFRRIPAPVIADAYIRAYRRANAGDVPNALIYDLADRHVDRMGEYFHSSSKEAMVEGFNSFVNRKLAARAAADRVLDAYGLTPRQMRGYVSSSASLQPAVNTTEQRSLKGKVRDYITRSFRKRIATFADQEEHNVDQQAQQFAWMWMVEKGRLSAESEKVWITAKDEKVCKICGPLHGQRVGVNERFHSDKGDFWTPGVHPNCRCFVRLIEHTYKITKGFGKADWWAGDWQEKEHPRGEGGQFANKAKPRSATQPRTQTKTKPRVITAERTAPDPTWLKQMRALSRADVLDAETENALEADTALGVDTDYALGADTALDAPAATKAVQATADPGLDVQALGVTALDVEALDATALTVEDLLEANPALSVEHLVESSTQFDQAVQTATAVATNTKTALVADVYEMPGEPATGENLLYYYDDSDMVARQGNKVQFDTNVQWLKGNEGRAELFARVQRDVNNDIQETLRSVLHDDIEQRMEYYKDADGGEHVVLENPDGRAFAISADDLQRIITDAAYKQESEPLEGVYMWNADDPSESDGESVPVLTAEEVLETINVKPEDFERPVYVAARGHDEQAVQLEPGSRGGFEVWLNTGDFEVTHESSGARNEGVWKLVNVEPDAPVRRHEIPPGD